MVRVFSCTCLALRLAIPVLWGLPLPLSKTLARQRGFFYHGDCMAFLASLPRPTWGLLLSALGMVIISPDGLFLHMMESASLWDTLFWRCAGIGVTLFLGLAVLYRRRLWGMIAGLGRIGWLSAGLLGLSNLFFVDAMVHTSVANTLVFMASMPLWSAICGLIFIKEAVLPRTWVAIAVGLVGIGVIVSGSLHVGGDTLHGDLAALGSAISFGLNLVVLRKAGNRDMTAALMMSEFLTAAVAAPFIDPAALSAHDWGLLALQGFGYLPIALTLFMAGARYAPAAEVALLALIETTLGPLWVWLFLSETPSEKALIGGALIISAIVANTVLGMVRPRTAYGEP